ncbi:MAG TPA: caspase family protein [Kiritimatiellia bacterium]|nr:caspase family protein [Kiritimatiellia bacterium]
MSELTQKQRTTLMLQEAQGKMAVLCVGIGKYDKSSGFDPLETCVNDAQTISEVFRDVWQLNADRKRISLLTSQHGFPSMGEIVKAVKRLAESAEDSERVLFYFSGHGHRLDDTLYLVPQDAVSDNDPDVLIKFSKIMDILRTSRAKQKIVILDACLCGSTSSVKKLGAAKFSTKELAKYMEGTAGVAILSSSTSDEPSLTKSPNPELSLFTYYLVKALNGERKALDETLLLTLPSLYDYISVEVQRTARSYQAGQTPTVDMRTSGIPVLGNFGQSIVSPEAFSFDGRPFKTLKLSEKETMRVDEVLTNIKNWTYSQDYLERKVNESLGDHLREDLGKKSAALREAVGFATSEIGVEDGEITFPGGTYSVWYVAEDKKRGHLKHSLSLSASWLSRTERIPDVLDALGMRPEKITFGLSVSLNPVSMIAGLEARGWKITSQLSDKVEASADGFVLIARTGSLSFYGLKIEELFAPRLEGRNKLAYSALALLGSSRDG